MVSDREKMISMSSEKMTRCPLVQRKGSEDQSPVTSGEQEKIFSYNKKDNWNPAITKQSIISIQSDYSALVQK